MTGGRYHRYMKVVSLLWRIVPLIALGLSDNLVAGDISGAWTGSMDVNGTRIPINLMLRQCDGKTISGTISIGNTAKAQAISNVARQGSKLTFVSYDQGRVVGFRLVVKDSLMAGDVIERSRAFKVSLSLLKISAPATRLVPG